MAFRTGSIRLTAAGSLLFLLAGCIPPPEDIGIDYSGPIYRKPGAEAARTASSGLPPASTAECPVVTELPTRKRSDCGVRLTMQRYNAGLQTLYQRRLTDLPTLKGSVVLRMIIAPDGSVQGCDVASSDLRDTELMRQIVAYVRTISFGSLDAVPTWSDTYTLEFSPPSEAVPQKAAGTTK